MSATRGFVPDLLLEQYALGELSEAGRLEIEVLLASEPSLRLRLAEIRASDEAILAEASPGTIASAIRLRLRLEGRPRFGGRLRLGGRLPMLSPADDRETLGLGAAGRENAGVPRSNGASETRRAEGRAEGRARSFRPASAVLLPVAAAVLVLVGAVMTRGLLFPTASELTRPKGGAPGLFIYKKAAGGPVELGNGSPASAGDVLQVKYAGGPERYGAIFSLDGRGNLTQHLPPRGSGAKAPRLSSEGAALGSAYELDDAPGFERFFLLSSASDFDLSVAAAALQALAAAGPQAATGAPRLPAGIEWKSLLLVKKAVSR